jgi:DNA invertase Pin-like site-specific DNA recombinase
MANIGYARVSTDEQDLSLQLDALQLAGCTRIFTEKMSGTVVDRPQLAAALDYLRPGEDTLCVWRLDRLARSLRQLIDTVENLKARQIALRSLTEALDTSTPAGMMIFHVFGAMAEFERAIIRERTNAGLAAARARGSVGGRPRKVTQEHLRHAMAMMRDPQTKATDVAKYLSIHRTVLYRYVNGDGSLKPLGHHLLYGDVDQAEAAD